MYTHPPELPGGAGSGQNLAECWILVTKLHSQIEKRSSCNKSFEILQQPFTTTFYNNLLQQPFTTTFYNNLLQQPFTTTFTTTFYNNLLQQPFTTTFTTTFYNNLLQQPFTTTCHNNLLQQPFTTTCCKLSTAGHFLRDWLVRPQRPC